MIEFDGPDRDAEELAAEIESDFEEERQRALEEARDQAKRVVPVDTGKLKRAVEIRGNSVVADTDYAARINWGFTGTDSLGRTYDQEGTFFLTDAALDSFQNSIERLRS